MDPQTPDGRRLMHWDVMHWDVMNEALSGPSSAPVVLWLHGFLGDRRDWQPLAASFPHYQHLFVDLPGHGSSPPFSDESPGFDRVVIELMTIIRGLRTAPEVPIHVVGYSLGARVAMALAPVLADAGRLGRLALVSGHPGIGDAAARQARLAVDQRRAAGLRSVGLKAFVADWYELPLLRSLKTLPGATELIARRSDGDADARARTLLALSTGHQPDRIPAVKALGDAVMWMAGAADAVYAPLLTRAQEQTPAATLRLISGAAHHVHLAQPALCRAALQAHLSGPEAS